MNPVVLHTDFPDLPLAGRGKVRDIYDLGKALLIVTTDRISAFDVIMNEGIPGKGEVLTQISAHWFRRLYGDPKSWLTGWIPDQNRFGNDRFWKLAED